LWLWWVPEENSDGFSAASRNQNAGRQTNRRGAKNAERTNRLQLAASEFSLLASQFIIEEPAFLAIFWLGMVCLRPRFGCGFAARAVHALDARTQPAVVQAFTPVGEDNLGVVGKGVLEDAADALAWFMT